MADAGYRTGTDDDLPLDAESLVRDGVKYVQPRVRIGPTYHTLVEPEIATVVTPEIVLDGVGTGTFVPDFCRVTVDPGDDITAAARLMAGGPDVFWLWVEHLLVIQSNAPIQNLYLVGLDLDGAVPANYDGNAYIVAGGETDVADWQAEMAHFTFDSEDDVREVVLEASPVYDTNYVRVKVQGVSYA